MVITPKPLNAGTKYTSSVSSTEFAISADFDGSSKRPKFIAHCTIEPVSFAAPSMQYTNSDFPLFSSVYFHATNGYRPYIDAGHCVPVFKFKNEPVPRVIFISPVLKQHEPHIEADWSPNWK